MSGIERIVDTLARGEPRFAMRNLVFGATAVATQALALAAVSMLAGYIYHAIVHASPGPLLTNALVGLLAGIAYVAPFLARNTYSIDGFLTGSRQPGRIFVAWNTAILSLALLAFLTKTTADFSRGWLILFYVLGLITVISVEALIALSVRAGLRAGHLVPRRIMLIGSDVEIRAFSDRFTAITSDDERIGVRVIAVATLPGNDAPPESTAFAQSLALGAAKARAALPDDIVVLKPWTEAEAIAAVVEAFSLLPVAIHLDGGAMLASYADVRVTKVGSAATLSLTEPPLTALQVVGKRAFDLVVGAIALVLAAPLLIAVAIAIRRSSPGPVLFRQRRLGFNQREFRIFKFRSMEGTGDDGNVVPQAGADDARITAIGAFIRRWNIDELPQLFNVLRGEMSLVGPRPHAVAHDRDFEKRIVRYPRRLNMKPGITGWAQVNGYRGETRTDDKMAKRVEYDLYYIDHWSLTFDVYILVLTLVSPSAYNNAK